MDTGRTVHKTNASGAVYKMLMRLPKIIYEQILATIGTIFIHLQKPTFMCVTSAHELAEYECMSLHVPSLLNECVTLQFASWNQA